MDCLFENVYGLKATEDNKMKAYGKEFIGWVKPEAADDSMWEDAEEDPGTAAPPSQDLMEEFEEVANGGRETHSTGLRQLDIETGKIVIEWKFGKDGTEITMNDNYDITNDTKGSQLDSSESTFLGLDDNRLCQWDMRDRRGMVQNIASSNSPVLQ
ncbi:hypothetical protein HS088_TW22G00943 [Tripterygium wilfordii]|uniref:Vacuolar import/degradation Vid27 C-terminal domain-containing protein n=1 Tax=Tripterygium wilfordii TaxID=458696 RepID=A0A7J7BZF5_TRIWF|nr:hypothetical protein HS088_TW22G00943 [Tripterygium wilfordii]